jgi:hypothetical protein
VKYSLYKYKDDFLFGAPNKDDTVELQKWNDHILNVNVNCVEHCPNKQISDETLQAIISITVKHKQTAVNVLASLIKKNRTQEEIARYFGFSVLTLRRLITILGLSKLWKEYANTRKRTF